MQAYIGGVLPVSTTDWPGKVCMIVFFGGCNFRCPYCKNPFLVDFREEHLKDLKEIKKEIEGNSDFVDGVLFSGGEPCLQRQALLSLARYSKGIGLKTGIETNGSKPDALNSLVRENLIDYIQLDIKADFNESMFEKVTRSRTFFQTTGEVVGGINKTISLLKENSEKTDFEVCTTVVPTLLYKKEDVLKIADIVKDIRCRWVLQQFKPENGVLDRKFQKIDAPSEKFLENLKEFCIRKHPSLKIEIRCF